MRKLIAILLGLGAIVGAIPVFLGFWNQSQATGNPEDLYAGLFLGGMCVFIGVLILVASGRTPRNDPDGDAATLWAVGMASAQDASDAGDY